MKISKLFHWLYAILMLLPIMVFIPNAFYYGFNKEAVSQEKTEQVPVYYQTNEVTSQLDLIEGNVYRIYSSDIVGQNISTRGILCEKIWVYGTYRVFNNQVSYTRPYILVTPNGSDSSYLIFHNVDVSNRYYVTNGYIDFVYSSYESSSLWAYIKSCDTLYVKEYQPLTTSMSITDSMSYAWDSVWQNDLFSWSYGSFLTQPFIYIGNLFNVPVDNTLYYALSYWLDISIIWLCFDVLMYVPLLVHRWLDKGIIE